jgi:hypothetical protein
MSSAVSQSRERQWGPAHDDAPRQKSRLHRLWLVTGPVFVEGSVREVAQKVVRDNGCGTHRAPLTDLSLFLLKHAPVRAFVL